MDAPFATGAGRPLSDQVSRETLINMYVEQVPGGKGQIVRTGRPGLRKLYEVGGEPRGVARLRGADYAVIGDGFYRVGTTSAQRLGSLFTAAGGVSFAENTTQIAICDGAGIYVWDGTTFSRVTIPVSAGSITGIDGYGIFNDRNSGRFYRTNLNDFKVVDPLNFATAETQPDKLVRAYADHREVWLFGERSIEVWANSGAAGFGFQRLGGVAIERGCAAAMSVASEDNALFWLGDDGWVYRANGYQPVRISNAGIERIIAGAAPWTDARGWVYSVPGHRFYVLSFPGRATVVYDIATGLWHQARTWGAEDWAIVGAHKLGAVVALGHGGACQIVHGLTTDAGGPLERGGISAPIVADGKRFVVDAYLLDAEVGTAPLGVEPSIMLAVSRDGETWGNERHRSLGVIGRFRHRAVWRQLGLARQMSMRFRVTDDVPFTVVGAKMDARILAS